MIRKVHLNVLAVLFAVAGGATAAAEVLSSAGDYTVPVVLLSVSAAVNAAVHAYENNSRSS